MRKPAIHRILHEYDIARKTFLCQDRESLRALKSLTVDRWHKVELPEVRNRRLVHIELQSTHDAAMALRMMEYCAAVRRQFGRFPEQVVLYVGEAPLRMTGGLSGPSLSFECRIVDIRELDGEKLLESAQIADNIIAVLAHVNDQRAAVKRILRRIAEGDPAERTRALTGLLILAGLRRLGEVIEQEVSQMPILDDIMDHPVLGREFKRGLAQGLAQGLEQGRHDGEVAVLLRQIERRFGSVPSLVRDRVAKMSVTEVESAALRLLDARSVEDLLG